MRRRGSPSKELAARYHASRASVDALKQRYRETAVDRALATNEVPPSGWKGKSDRLKALLAAQPDATLAELRAALPTSAGLATLWRAIQHLDFTVKNRYTPTNSVALTWPRRVGTGGTGNQPAMRRSTSFSTNVA